MFKKIHSKKGFTLAELLIVVAIIAVLTAIAIPVFSSQLDKAKLATGTANVRSAYAEYVADCMSATTPVEPSVTGFTGSAAYTGADLSDCTVNVTATAVTVTSPKGSTNSFSVDLAAGG